MKRSGLFAAVLLFAGVAHAQDADELIRRGNDLRRKGQDEAALREFQRAYELGATPHAAASLGLAEQQLRRWGDAERHLSQALRDKTDPWVGKNRAVLEKQVKFVRGQIGRLEITGDPAGAEVLVNNENVGTLPLSDPVPVTPGPVRVEVRSPGYLNGAMSVSVARGQIGRVDLRLERDARAVAPPTFDAAKAVKAATETPPVAEPTVTTDPEPLPKQPDEPRPSATLQGARWVAVGAGGLMLAAGVVGAIINHSNMTELNRTGGVCGGINPMGQAVDKNGKPDPICQSKLDTANTGKTVAIVGFAGAGVLAITSAILFFAF
jgi:PEGA domain